MDKTILETVEIILGGKPLSYYLAGAFFCFLAVLMSVYMHSRKRDPLSDHTPYKFSWKFMLWDNGKRMVMTLIVMFILFRIWDLNSIELSLAVGFAVAFGLDKIIQFMMDKFNLMKFLRTDREQFKKIGNENN